MIIGIGLDLVEISRIERLYYKYKKIFVKKILTPREIEFLPANPVVSLAGRFAAKEAAVKSLGIGFNKGIIFSEIEIIKNELGAPEIIFSGTAKKFFAGLGGKSIFVSITHQHPMAAAMVILEK